jgi:putative transposase
MPRTARASQGGYCYHVINRGNGRAEVFHKDGDYDAFVRLLADAHERLPMRVLGYCLMPNHFHLVLWPKADGDLSRWMQWLLTAHVRRYHQHYHSSGHVWQGRFKAFPIEEDEHLLTVLRYVERNALRAELVRRVERWRWSSLAARQADPRPAFLHDGPVARPKNWLGYVQEPLTAGELARVRHSVVRGTPFGETKWMERAARRLGLESTLRPRGRPRKQAKK